MTDSLVSRQLPPAWPELRKEIRKMDGITTLLVTLIAGATVMFGH